MHERAPDDAEAEDCAEAKTDAEARSLGERVARGELAEERLELLAQLGHAPARRALGERAPERVPDEADDLRDWLLDLERFESEAGLRAALAVGRLSVERPSRPGAVSRTALAALQAFLDCPCSAHQKAARQGWTRGAAYAFEVSWAELAAELAWDVRQSGTDERELRASVRDAVIPWALTAPSPDEGDEEEQGGEGA